MSILVTRDGALKTVVLNRPDRRNALDAATVEALIAAVSDSATDGTRLFVLRGEGKNTCAGFDMAEVETQSEGDLLLRFVRIEELLQALYHAPFHTLALAHGRVVGAGADLVLACRHRIAAPDAMFEMPGAGFGLVLGTGRLGAAVGEAHAAELLAGPFDAAKAERLGFLTGVASRADWDGLVANRLKVASALDSDTNRAILRVLGHDTRARDMAELVASAARPGLKERIAAYIAARMGAAR